MVWWNPGTWGKPSAPATTIVVQPSQTITTPSGQSATASQSSSGSVNVSGNIPGTVSVRSSTGATTYWQGTGGGGSSGGGYTQVAAPTAVTQEAPQATVTQPAAPTLQQKAIGFAEKYSAFAAYTSFPLVGVPGFGWTPKSVTQFRQGVYEGVTTGIIKHPVKAVVIGGIAFGTAAATPFVLAGAGAVGLGGAAIAVGEGITYAAPIIYGAVKIPQILQAPSPKESGNVLGTSISTEIAPAVVGGLAGQRAYLIGEGIIRGWNRQKLATEPLVGSDQYSGEKRFYEAEGMTSAQSKALTAQQRLDIFKKDYAKLPGYENQPTAYSATSGVEPTQLFPVKKIGEGQGLFVAPKISTNFLRLDYGSLNPYGNVNLFTGKPGVAATVGQTYSTSNTGQLGVAFVRAGKSEIEAIYPIGTGGKLISDKFAFVWKGVKVPIDVFKIVPSGTSGAVSTATIASSYSSASMTFSTPWQVLGISSLFSRPSTPSVPSSVSKPSFPVSPASPVSPSSPSRPVSFSYPPSGSTPSTPSTPSIPSIPSYPSAPSLPSTPSFPSFSYGPYSPYSSYLFSPRKSMWFDDSMGLRKLKTKQRKKYTPGVRELVLGIRGKQPKSKFQLALGARPIPKGFKWSFSGGNI